MEKRYSSIDELAEDFDKAAEPGILDRLRKHWRSIAAATVLGATLVGLTGIPIYNSIKQEHQAEQVEAQKYEVVAAVDGIELEIRNNLFDMSVGAFNSDLPEKPIPTYPDKLNFIRAKPGDKVHAYASLISKPLPQKKEGQWGIPTLEGRIYLEGTEGETIHISPRSPNGAIDYDMGMGYEDNSAQITLPKNIKPGNYNLVTEFYAPDTVNEGVEKANLKFTQPGKIIARKSVIVTVGDETLPFKFRELILGYPNRVYFGPCEQYGRSNEPGLNSIVQVSGQEPCSNTDYSVNVHIKPAREGAHRLIKMTLQHNGHPIYKTATTAESFSEISNLWVHYVPDKNFYKTLQKVVPLPLEQ